MPLIVLGIATWFAFLNSRENMRFGLIRLYLAGFLLPYLVWTPISQWPAESPRSQQNEAGKVELSSDKNLGDSQKK